MDDSNPFWRDHTFVVVDRLGSDPHLISVQNGRSAVPDGLAFKVKSSEELGSFLGFYTAQWTRPMIAGRYDFILRLET